MDAPPELPELHRRTLQRMIAAQARQLALMVGCITLSVFTLTILAIILQAQQTDVRSAERIIAVSDADPDPALVRYIVARQRRNFTPQIRVVGTAPERLAEALREAGITAADLDIAAPTSLAQQLRADLPPAAAPTLLLAEPHDLVLARKISRDHGLNTVVGAPPDLALQIGPTLRAALSYWNYTLLGAE